MMAAAAAAAAAAVGVVEGVAEKEDLGVGDAVLVVVEGEKEDLGVGDSVAGERDVKISP